MCINELVKTIIATQMSDYMMSVKRIVDRHRLLSRSEFSKWRNSGSGNVISKDEKITSTDSVSEREIRGSSAEGIERRNTNDQKIYGANWLSPRPTSGRTLKQVLSTHRLSDDVFLSDGTIPNESYLHSVARTANSANSDRNTLKGHGPLISVTKCQDSVLRASGTCETPETRDQTYPQWRELRKSSSNENEAKGRKSPLPVISIGIGVPMRHKHDQIPRPVSEFRPRLSFSKSVPLSPPAATDDRLARRLGEVQFNIDTVRSELMSMQKMDQDIARKMLTLYNEIRELKIKHSCLKHSELLDEAIYEAEMADDLPDMCDAPQKSIHRLLTSHGVTSYNIHARRFSCS